jgi:aspartate racemase
MKKIGIIGGAGPFASCLLYQNIIQEAYKHGCKNESELPAMALINHPFSIHMCTTLFAHDDKPLICSVLQSCVDTLLQQDTELLAVACNTFHVFLKEVNPGNAAFVNIACSTMEVAEQQKLSKVLILGTSLTLNNQLYTHATIECVATPKREQKIVENIINNILAGKICKHDAIILQCMIHSLITKLGCDGVVLGCTELSVLHAEFPLSSSDHNNTLCILDTIKILAQKLVKESFA